MISKENRGDSKQIETRQIRWKTHQIWRDLTGFGEISLEIVEIT